jgi:iron complex outermembrane recepter protein
VLEQYQDPLSFNRSLRTYSNLKLARPLWLCFFLLVFSVAASAQIVVQGVVVDAISNKPVAGAVVIVQDTIYSTTDQEGCFSFSLESKLDITLSIVHLTHTGDFQFSRDELTSMITVRVAPTPVHLTICYVYSRDFDFLQTPGAMGHLSASDISQGDGTSLLNGLNSVPGVKMEERGYGGSRRINIRGSFLRSPFAVRNIKMYWEGIPMTSPDGSSPLELFDNSDIGAADVIKGPAGSIYGAGNGGVLLLKGIKAHPNQKGIGSSVTVGEYGLLRSNSYAAYADKTWNIRISGNYQYLDGYREQESNEKQQLNVFLSEDHGGKFSHYLYATYYDAFWELPGSISAAAMEENPRQAVPYSIEGNASLSRIRKRVGVSQRIRLTEKMSFVTSGYINQTEKTNPYGTSAFFNGFKDEAAEGWGARSEMRWRTGLGDYSSLETIVGGEYQSEDNSLTEFTNDLGGPGGLKYSNQTTSTAYMAFANAVVNFREKTLVDLGISVNDSRFLNSGSSYAADEVYDLGIDLHLGSSYLPRVALSQQLLPYLFAHGSVSYGHSYPSLFEMVDVASGALNPNLRGESGVNYEGGLKFLSTDQTTKAEVSLYQFDLKNSIIPQDNGLFANAGKTDQSGLEASISHSIIWEEGGVIKGLSVSSALAWNHYQFREYVVVGGEDLSGRFLTGTPLATLADVIEVRFPLGFKLRASHYWYDKSPLNDDNSDWSAAYNLVNAQLKWGLSRGRFAIDSGVGVNNLLDVTYSSFYQLNAFGGRYFNPSPGRNFFATLSVQVNFDKAKRYLGVRWI